MSLARRIDYEAARAAEWRAGELRALEGAERVEAALRAEGEGAPPARAVLERARRLLGSPGSRAINGLAAAVFLLCALAATAGVQVARLALGDPADGPVNIVWFLGHALGLQTLFLLPALVATFLGRSGLGRLLGRTLSLGAMALSAAVRLASPGKEGAGAEIVERLRGLRELRPLALAASHGAWTSFNIAVLAAAALILSAEHHAFAWQSTFVQDEAKAERLLRALTLPSAIWPGAPSAEQVSVSRYDPEAGAFLDDGGDPRRALALRQGWSMQLLAGVAGWGLAPRLLLLAVATWSWRRARRRLAEPLGDPYFEAALARLRPAIETEASAIAQEPLPAAAPLSASPADGPLVRQAAAWLGAADDRTLAELLGPDWSLLPRLDSRAGERAALAALQRPAELALVCDWASTPDASLDAWLREASPARTRLLLSGGAAFRRSSRGASPEQLRARRALWEEAAARLGVAAADLVDFDADSATPDSIRQLRAALDGEQRPAAPARAGGFGAALERLRDDARGWPERLAGLQGEELEAGQLRCAAEARRAVEACFADTPPPARAGHAVVRAARSALRGRLDGAGLREDAWSQALGEAARLGRLLARVPDIDPRWSAAGLVLGIVAGPLGGAVAAGSAGLVAGASLMGTLGPVGAAIGSALSLRGGEASEQEAAPADLLGLPARAAALRAVELALQGRGEEELARVLSELLVDEAACASLDGPDEVDALCRAAARVVAEAGS